MRAAAIIVAGGSGARMGQGAPKQFLDLAGSPVLLWSVRTFLAHPSIGRLVVVLPPAEAQSPPGWLSELPVAIASGGAARGDSVRAGLESLDDEYAAVAVHDAARPLVSQELITAVLEAVHDGGAIAAVPVADTIKVSDGSGRITRTVDREGLWLAQTPQAFPLRELRELHRRAAADGVVTTDDAALFEHYGRPVRIVTGVVENLKITRPGDLVLAAALARAVSGAAPGAAHEEDL